jgi:hypothetical protein
MKPLPTAHQEIAARALRDEVRDDVWRRYLLARQILELSEIEIHIKKAIIGANLFDPHLSPLPQRELIEQAEGLLSLGEFDYAQNACECAELALIARRQTALQTGASI